MTKIIKKILVTCALPYANGSIHLGHMLEHIQADIWVRYQKMQGHTVHFICADDSHGTPIMLKAQQLNISPEIMIREMNLEHRKDFSNFSINYDNYHSTHSDESREFCSIIYNRLKKNGLIKTRTIAQLFDLEKKMFLPDRFVKGNCPKCKSFDQYGDNCEKCGSTYNTIELINPKSILSGTVPVIKKSKHLFFDLPVFREMLYNLIIYGALHIQVANKMKEWFKSGLQQWNISRDAPYFGFEIPDAPGKYFYVWLDAPIGYIGSFKNLCNKRGDINFDDYWKKDSDAELYHFIGKDIIYFHSLFWPAILEGSNFRKPNNLFVHGYVTINGTKMSKSRGTFIKASTYIKHLDPDCLRYYYASKLSSSIEDIDLNFKDFICRFNSDIVNKIVNLASRISGFITNKFDGYLSEKLTNIELYDRFISAAEPIGKAFNHREFGLAIRNITNLADLANCYIDEKAPWIIAKNPNCKKELQSVCSMGLNMFRILMIYLKPVLPSLVERAEAFLNIKESIKSWDMVKIPLTSHRINSFQLLFRRIEENQVKNMIEESYK